MINSCNDVRACQSTDRDGAFDELIDCCNDVNNQCQGLTGANFFAAGTGCDDVAALKAFEDRCDATNIPGLSGSDAYVDCVDGFVKGDYGGQTCADACIVNGVSECCTGTYACGRIESNAIDNGFTGKGK